MSRKFWLVTILSLVVSAVSAVGQDLGSSNGLFGAKKTKISAVAPKKSPTKRKPVAVKAKTPTRPVRAASRSVRSAAKHPVKTVHKPEDNRVAAQKPKVEPTPAKITPVVINVPPTINKPVTVNKPPDTAVNNDLFERLIVEGNVARDERAYLAAESSYQRAKTIKPNDSRAIYGLGNLYADQQRWEEAEKAYRAALQLESSSSIINVALSYVLSQPIAVPNLSDRYEEAEKLARRAIDLAPSNALAFDQLGVSLELRGIISSETENAYRNAIRLDSSFAPSYAHLGRLLRRRGMAKESARAYDDAIRRATDVPTMIVIADVMQSEQRFAESESLLKKAVEEDPKNPAGLLLLGKAWTTLGKYDEAEKILRRSQVVSPNGFMPNSLLGTLYTRQNKYDLAESALLQALRFVSPNEKRNLALGFESVGDGYLKTGKARNAERAYRQAISLDPEKESLAGKLARSQRS